MLSLETLMTFLAASILLGLAPGPDNIFVLTQSAMHGRWAGIIVTLGLCTGLVMHSAAVAFGVAAIFQKSAIAFSILKYLGAGYLLYLAWQAFQASGDTIGQKPGAALNRRQLYGRGIIMNITNPKVSIFFLAFLPQFADPSKGPIVLQLLLLGGLFIIATIAVFGCIAMVAGAIGLWLNRSKLAQKTLSRVAGAVFLGLALKLATTER